MGGQVLFAMTDAENKDTNAATLKRKFSFFSTGEATTDPLALPLPLPLPLPLSYVGNTSDGNSQREYIARFLFLGQCCQRECQ